MSLIALAGSLTLILQPSTLEKILLPLVAFAAGSLLGGAFFHMLPTAVREMNNHFSIYLWLVFGFLLFLALEQFLHWHHSHEIIATKVEPLTYLILVADALHNFVGGLFVGGSFLIDTHLGMTAWFAAAAHEIPQELGDFAVLIHGGCSSRRALWLNFLSATTFLFGALFVYVISGMIDVAFLIPFAAGNFIYIAAADLIPEIKQSRQISTNLLHFSAFIAGLTVLLAVRWLIPVQH